MIDLSRGEYYRRILGDIDGFIFSKHRTRSRTHSRFLEEISRPIKGFIWELERRSDLEEARKIEGYNLKVVTVNPLLFGHPISNQYTYVLGGVKGLIMQPKEGDIYLRDYLEYGQEVEEEEEVKKLKEYFSPYYLEGKHMDDMATSNAVYSWEYEKGGYVDRFGKRILEAIVELRVTKAGFRGISGSELVEHLGEREERVQLYLKSLVKAGYLRHLPNMASGEYLYYTYGRGNKVAMVLDSGGVVSNMKNMVIDTFVNDLGRLRRVRESEVDAMMGWREEGISWKERINRPLRGVVEGIWEGIKRFGLQY